ncbi:MAG: hypothetical protein F6J97_23550 [Leptolyngbya sp. SIO4C1]|nr:hypothetical protein [Leptolyngbya sp. SIO4C1]
MTAVAATAFGATASLGLLPGLGAQAARAESVTCSNEWAQQAIDYLKTKLGYTPPFYFCYQIDAGETETTYITFDETDLSMGENHAFVAECDSDCADLDLRIYDEYGRLVGEDTTPDSYAEVLIRNIEANETYQVDITMYDCDAAYCGAVLGSTPRR